MKTFPSFALLSLFLITPVAQAQSSIPAQPATPVPDTKPPKKADTTKGPADQDSYYYFALGHLDEQRYETTRRPELAAQSIEAYKKALDLAPGSTVIMERLAEIYAKSQRVREAEVQAQNVLKLDPADVNARRLLAQIYVHALGDMGAGDLQKENLAKDVEQFQAILKLQPDDTYSALWLARPFCFPKTDHLTERTMLSTRHI